MYFVCTVGICFTLQSMSVCQIEMLNTVKQAHTNICSTNWSLINWLTKLATLC